MRALAAADRPRLGRPFGQVEVKLGDPGAFSVVAVSGERRLPGPLGQGENRFPHRLGQVEADREAHASPGEMVEEGVRGATRSQRTSSPGVIAGSGS